jgi:SynChlorMet cassette radical SAM/SPASM protein ScmE
MRFSVLSNGTLITEALANYLADTGACSGVQVSVDGAHTSAHESCRGKGSFEPALKGIRLLTKAGVRVEIRVTIHRYNVSDMAAIGSLLLNQYDLPGFSTNEAGAMGLCNTWADRIQLTTEERTRVMRDLLDLNERYSDRISASAGPLAEARLWTEMIHARALKKAAKNHQGFLSGCGCVFHKMAVRADGALVPCVQLSHLELGRAGQDDLEAIWHHHPRLKKLRERLKIPLAQFDFCRECDFTTYCTGNCPALAYTAFGDENHPSPAGCLHRFLANGGKLPGRLTTPSERS